MGHMSGSATNATGLAFSLDKFKKLQPEVFAGGLMNTLMNLIGAGPKWQIERLTEQLQGGDSSGALVMSVKPLIVSAYSEDLDCVILLRFPENLAAEYSLTEGSRLLTVNSYKERSSLGLAADEKPGPKDSGAFGFVAPLIADFVTDETDKLNECKRHLDEEHWAHITELSKAAMAKKPVLVRNGLPTQCGKPGAPLG